LLIYLRWTAQPAVLFQQIAARLALTEVNIQREAASDQIVFGVDSPFLGLSAPFHTVGQRTRAESEVGGGALSSHANSLAGDAVGRTPGSSPLAV
jgi:hypothetical protein